MAQMTEALAHAILAGDGITRSEIEQLCHFFLRHSADLARLTAELERRLAERPDITAIVRASIVAYNEGRAGNPYHPGYTEHERIAWEAGCKWRSEK